MKLLLLGDEDGSWAEVLGRVEEPLALSVASLADSERWLSSNQADAILLSLHPSDDHRSALRQLRRCAPVAPIVVLMDLSDPEALLPLIKEGADDFIDKTSLNHIWAFQTLRRSIERARLRTQLHSVVWHNADAIVVRDEHGRVLFANPAAARMFHLSIEALLGTVLDLPSEPGTADLQLFTGEGVTETEMRSTDVVWEGRPATLASIRDITVRQRAERAEQAAEKAEIQAQQIQTQLSLLLGQLPLTLWTADENLRVRSHHGADLGALGTLQGGIEGPMMIAHVTALRRGEASFELKESTRTYAGVVKRLEGEQGGACLVGMAIDVSERIALEAQFRQAQKMEAIGRLAGGVAHDFNNLLTVIGSFGQFVLDSLDPSQPAHSDQREVLRAAEQARNLTSQLLAFSRKQQIEPRVTNLNALVSSTEKMLRRVVGEHIEIETALSEDLWNVKVDPGVFGTVIVNLVINARDAMPDGGTLTIRTSNVEIDEDYVESKHRNVHIPEGRYAILSVSDNGVGMDEETRQRVFEPFFTTKNTSGTGLGLATCYGIVKQAAGFIWVYSQKSRGTTVEVYLPGVEEKEASERPVDASRKLTGTEVVLVTEDHPEVRLVATRALRDHGYTVLEAGSGEEGLEVARKTTGRLDLVLTDLVMPKLNGPEMAKRLEVLHPEARVLFMSGYDSNRLPKGAQLLPKPFTQRALMEKVRDVLDASEEPQEPRMRVLCVDDDVMALSSIRRFLKPHFEIAVASSGRKALGLLGTQAFDVVLCDILMPEMSGIELRERARAARIGAADRFVFMTGAAEDEYVQHVASEAGTPILPKPIDGSALDQLMRTANAARAV